MWSCGRVLRGRLSQGLNSNRVILRPELRNLGGRACWLRRSIHAGEPWLASRQGGDARGGLCERSKLSPPKTGCFARGAGCNERHRPASLLSDENWLLLLSCGLFCCSSTLCLGFPTCACTLDPQSGLREGGGGKSQTVRRLPPPRFASEVAEKENRAKVTVTQAVAAADALARRVFLQHTHGRRATHLQSLGSSRSAPPSGVESKPCLRGSGVRAEGSCPGRELSALARLAGRHAAAWSADGPGLEHRLL